MYTTYKNRRFKNKILLLKENTDTIESDTDSVILVKEENVLQNKNFKGYQPSVKINSEGGQSKTESKRI